MEVQITRKIKEVVAIWNKIKLNKYIKSEHFSQCYDADDDDDAANDDDVDDGNDVDDEKDVELKMMMIT